MDAAETTTINSLDTRARTGQRTDSRIASASTEGRRPDVVGLADLAAGAAELAVDASGVTSPPLLVVDLGRDEWAHTAAAVQALRRHQTRR